MQREGHAMRGAMQTGTLNLHCRGLVDAHLQHGTWSLGPGKGGAKAFT